MSHSEYMTLFGVLHYAYFADHMAGHIRETFGPGRLGSAMEDRVGMLIDLKHKVHAEPQTPTLRGKAREHCSPFAQIDTVLLSCHVIHLPRTLAALLLGLSQLGLYDLPGVSLNALINGYRFAMRIWSMKIPNTFTSTRCCHH
jgi:hypothetical protein